METRNDNPLSMDPSAEIERILTFLVEAVEKNLRRKGVVLGLSGGIDSSVCAALALRAFGPQRVRVLLMPERECDPGTTDMGRFVASHLGLEPMTEEISGLLEASGCYRRRDEAIREVVPDFGEGWTMKIKLPGRLKETGRLNVFKLEVRDPSGRHAEYRLRPGVLARIIAATNFKQRCRKMLEYHSADLLNFAVLGTPNRLEYELGFFVKNGDGAADLKPIAHLYKTQVRALGRALGLPREVLEQTPTTDTYSLAQTQEEFFFGLPLEELDRCLAGLHAGEAAAATAEALGWTEEEVERVRADLRRRIRGTTYLHAPALSLHEGVPGERLRLGEAAGRP